MKWDLIIIVLYLFMSKHSNNPNQNKTTKKNKTKKNPTKYDALSISSPNVKRSFSPNLDKLGKKILNGPKMM